MQLLALFRLALASAPKLQFLNLAAYINSPDRSTKSTTSHFDVLCVLVSTGFQVLFHSPPGVLFTFPSQYYFSIGHRVIFRLGGWSPLLPTGFLVSCGTLDTASGFPMSLTGLAPCFAALPRAFCYLSHYMSQSLPRPKCFDRFGLFRVRSPLLAESLLMSFPRPT